jgi:hypothetical protein
MFTKLITGAMALVLLAGPAAMAAACDRPPLAAAGKAGGQIDTYQGLVLSAAEGQLSMMFGTEQLTLTVAKDAKITLDGGPARLAELKPGYEVTVTVEQQDVRRVARLIQAKSVR